jgi:hypothetical protein
VIVAGANGRDEQGVHPAAAESAHARFFDRHRQRIIEPPRGRETQDAACIVAADPIASIAVDCRAIRAAGMPAHIDEQALAERRAAVHVIVEGPDLLARWMRIRQVHGAPVRRKRQSVLRQQPFHERVRQAQFVRVSVQLAVRPRGRHVHHHGAAPEAPLAVAAAIVKAHVCAAVFNLCQQRAIEAAIGVRRQVKKTTLHAGNPATLAMSGDAGEHLRGFPDIYLAVGSAPALQRAIGNVYPIQRVFLRHPHRAFTDCVAGVDDQFGLHAHSLGLL